MLSCAAAGRQGNGVLAHTQFGQLIRREQDKQPPAYLGRHIVIGTVVDTRAAAGFPLPITAVIDMRDKLSPLQTPAAPPTQAHGNALVALDQAWQLGGEETANGFGRRLICPGTRQLVPERRELRGKVIRDGNGRSWQQRCLRLEPLRRGLRQRGQGGLLHRGRAWCSLLVTNSYKHGSHN